MVFWLQVEALSEEEDDLFGLADTPIELVPSDAGGLAQKCSQHGHAIQNVWQSLPLVSASWSKGMQPEVVKAGWKACGFSPWSPDRLLVEQAPELFRSVAAASAKEGFLDRASASKLRLPPSARGDTLPCASCKVPIAKQCRFCSSCGVPNEAFCPDAQLTLGSGSRPGYKKQRPQRFDPQALIAQHIETLVGPVAPVADDPYMDMKDGEPGSSQELPEDELRAGLQALMPPPAAPPPLPAPEIAAPAASPPTGPHTKDSW